jgi:TolB-like protein/class 3 adenylate cyclase/Flp pilus assembly protein TadD
LEPARELRVATSVSEANAKAAKRSERKLTSIMVADVVGYSRLTAADEEGTITRLRDLRSELVDPAVARHRGRIIKTMGDGFLIEFPSIVDAVQSSLEIQHGVSGRQIGDASASIRLRVGIHISDVVVEPDGDLLGDGVNIAARLQEIADPGTVCLSEDAFHQVRNKISVPVIDKGKVELKNIPQPVRVYALQAGDNAGDTKDMPAGAASAPPLSIVVLPFSNLGQVDADAQFADGITETLTTDLARIAHSAVIARNTAFTFKGKAVDARQIGKQLGVKYILEGSVQRSGDRIRVNVQLIDAESGNHLWADRFDKTSGDLLQMQDEIVARVAGALNAPLMAAEAQRAERSAEPASMDLYFQGMAWVNKGLRPDWLAQARRCFEKAKAIDDTNVEALIGVGMVDTLRGVTCVGDNPAGALESAESLLTDALSSAPDHAWAHCLMAAVLISTRQAERGIMECERGLSLNPSLASAHAMLGLANYLLGQGEETESHVEEALRLSPLDTFAYLWMLFAGVAKIQTEEYDKAVEWLRRSTDTNCNSPWAYFHLGAALQLSGKAAEARAETQAGLLLDPTFTTERYRSLAFSDHRRYLTTRERTIQALQATGVP